MFTPKSANARIYRRDARGRFAKRPAPARATPFARWVAGLRAALLRAVDARRLTALIDVLVSRAKAGDLGAIRLVLRYAVGKPA